jgi:hypothetical protein
MVHLLVRVETFSVLEGSGADHSSGVVGEHFLQAKERIGPDHLDGPPDYLEGALQFPLPLADGDGDRPFYFVEDVQGNPPGLDNV